MVGDNKVLARYGAQVVLPYVGVAGQEKLARARVLLVGAGGLGVPVAQQLVAAGIGRLEIIDFDRVEEGNLNRQYVYLPTDIGYSKAEVLAERLAAQNPMVDIVYHHEKLGNRLAAVLVGGVDLVVDASDNLPTRYMLNDICVLLGKAWVMGAIYRHQGQVALWNSMGVGAEKRVNYRDWEPNERGAAGACSEVGVLPMFTGVIGSLQAMEAVKYLLGMGPSLANKLLIYDVLSYKQYVMDIYPNRGAYIERVPKDLGAFLRWDYGLGGIGAEDKLINMGELEEWRALGRVFLLIDLRQEDEVWEEGDILEGLGAYSLPFERYNGAVELAKDRELVLYCPNGRRSGVVGADLRRRGYVVSCLVG